MAPNRDAKVTIHNGRILVVLADEGDGEFWPHGIVVCPAAIQDKETVRAAIDRAFYQVVDADPDEWNYDDVIDRLTAEGFEWVGPVYWVEEEAERPADM